MKKIISAVMCLMMIFTTAPLESLAQGIKDNGNLTESSSYYESEQVVSYAQKEEKLKREAAQSSVLVSSNPSGAAVDIVPSNDERLSGKYLSMYSVSNSYFETENNGGGLSSNPFTNAFDRNWNTLWRSESQQVDGFMNTVTATFKNKVSLDRILYQCDGHAQRGYPKTLKISFANGTEDFTNELTITSSETTEKVMFSFDKVYECTKIQLQWVSIPTYNRYEASAKEIIFLQPETDETKAIDGLFSDYNAFNLSEKYNSLAAVEQLEEALKSNINYDIYYKSQIERAKKVLLGELTYNPKYEFSTSDENTGAAKILQHGALREYTQNTLRTSWFGIDRQATGLYGKTGDVLSVYVDADGDEDCLPSLSLTQHFSSSGNWRQDFSLKRGLNIITVPDFGAASHTAPAVAGGGPIYILNPFTSSEQGKVRVYIEGAESFPLYRKQPEDATLEEKTKACEDFLKELKAYCSKGFTAGQYPLDLLELQSDHCLMTVKASLGENMYITSANGDNMRAQNNLENYDAYMERLLKFEGITFDKNNKYYDERNEYIGINFRASQNTGVYAYATVERVGLLNDGFHNTVLYSTGIGRGWGLTHEIGHTLDMHSDRTKHELTNNMLSKYNETALGGGDGTRGDFNADIANLSSDRKDYTASSYLNSNMYNFCIWWHLESYKPGYWGDLANMFRYYHKECSKEELDLINTLDKDEKQVYYSSLILGIDLGYYYERYGFKIHGSKQFTEGTATDNYKTLMANAVADGRIDNTEKPRFWYLDEKQYNLVAASDGVDTLKKAFEENEQTEIISIEKTDEGYSLVMPYIKDSTTLLGYEIYEGENENEAEVIGFSKTGVFVDNSQYPEGYTPTYWVKGYNRNLSFSAISEPKTLGVKSSVCAIGETEYTSVKEAVTNAVSGDTIVLLSDITETGVVIDKNLTIGVKDAVTLTYYRGSTGSLFTVGEGVTLTINGDGRLTLDGNLVSQNGALITLSKSSVLNLNGVTLQNSVSTSNGGAVYVPAATLNVTSCIFKNNSAPNGGAIAAGATQGRITINQSTFENNKANSNGGAIYNIATTSVADTDFIKNTATNGGAICNINGGIVRTYSETAFENNSAQNGGALWLDGKTEIESTSLTSNKATVKGGGIYYSTNGPTRPVTVSRTTFTNNTSDGLGGEIYALINNANAKLTLNNSSISLSPCFASNVYIEKGNLVLNETPLKSLGMTNTQGVTASENSNGVVLTADSGVTVTIQKAVLGGEFSFPNLQLGESGRILGTVINSTEKTDLEIEAVNGFTHTESSWIEDITPTCTETGARHTECTMCKTHIKDEIIPKTQHTDENGDGKCDYCEKQFSTPSACSCNCHKSGFMGFIWKILRFFYKLFGTNKICSCGAVHY